MEKINTFDEINEYHYTNNRIYNNNSDIEIITPRQRSFYAIHKCLQDTGTGLLDLSNYDKYEREYINLRFNNFVKEGLHGTMAEELLLGHDDEEDYF